MAPLWSRLLQGKTQSHTQKVTSSKRMATRQMLLDRASEVDGGFWSKTRLYMRRLRDDQNTSCRPVAVPVQYEVIIR